MFSIIKRYTFPLELIFLKNKTFRSQENCAKSFIFQLTHSIIFQTVTYCVNYLSNSEFIKSTKTFLYLQGITVTSAWFQKNLQASAAACWVSLNML